MKLRSILCPVDYSENSRFALDYAETLARDSGAELHVIHCYHDPVPYQAGYTAAVDTVDIETETVKLHSFTHEAEDIKYQHHLVKGTAPSAINEYAQQQQVDLIVMGTHGRSGLSRLLLGSVAEDVLRHASCPVMTIRQKAKQLQDAES